MATQTISRQPFSSGLIRRAGRIVTSLGLLLAAGCAEPAGWENPLIPENLKPVSPEIRTDFLLDIDSDRVQLTRDYFTIHHPRLAASLPDGDDEDAIRFEPRMIVVHYTAIPGLQDTMEYFQAREIEGAREVIRQNGLLNVGVQFVVDRDGTIYRSYPETAMARHTIGLNHVAIGIENVGTGDLDEAEAEKPLTRDQLEANVDLVRYLVDRHPSIRFLIGHQEYRFVEDPRHPAHSLFHEELPGYRTEKSDPGPRFLHELRNRLEEDTATAGN